MASFKHKIVEKKISHWTLGKGTTEKHFAEMYPEMKRTFAAPEIKRLLTVVQVDDPTDDDVLQLWFNIGEAANEAKLEKWGVVVPAMDFLKKMTFDRMVAGAGKPRGYQIKIDASEEVVLAWCKE